MPPTNDSPLMLRPYLFFGVDLSWTGDADAIGTCPFCQKERKFFVSQKNGMYDCKTCDAGTVDDRVKSGGNSYTFLRKLIIESMTNVKDLEALAKDRGLQVETLKRWGLTQSCIDGDWLFPAYGPQKEVDGKRVCNINNVYKYVLSGNKHRFMSTPKPMEHCLIGTQFLDDKKPNILVCEGHWDPLAIDEQFRKYKNVATEDFTFSYKDFNILAVPGCETFKDEWVRTFAGKNVWFLYDNDHPRYECKKCRKTYSIVLHDKCQKCGSTERLQDRDGNDRIKPPAGLTGMKNAARKVGSVAKSVHVVMWGAEGHDERLPDGHDARDHLVKELANA